MAVRFVLGPAGSGKTHRCLRAIGAALAELPDGDPLWLLVPEQATLQMERMLVDASPRGGFARAEVLSFARLAERFSIRGALVSRTARLLALRRVLQVNRAELRVLGSDRITPGMLSELERAVESLLSAGWMPEPLGEAAAAAEASEGSSRTSDRLHDLSLILQCYIDWLGAERIDPALRLRRVRAALGAQRGLPRTSIWVDGFAGFTHEEAETLIGLAEYASTVEITLIHPGDGTDDGTNMAAGAWRRTHETQVQLRGRLVERGVALADDVILAEAPPRFAKQRALQALERRWRESLSREGAGGEDQRQPIAGLSDCISVLRCATVEEELVAATREIVQAVDAGEVRYRDCAIIVRDVAAVLPIAGRVLSRYGVPHFVDARRSLGPHPLSRLVLGLMQAVDSSGSLIAMRSLLAADLFPWSRAAQERLLDQVELLEPQSLRAWSGRWRDDEAWRDAAQARRILLEALAPLQTLHQEGASTASGWARGLVAALEHLRTRATLEKWLVVERDTAIRDDALIDGPAIHRQAWETIADLLTTLDETLGSVHLTLGELRGLLGALIESQTLGLTPPTLDQVLVGAVDRSRHPELERVWLIGMNDGVFPAARETALVLDDALQQQLAGYASGPGPLPSGAGEPEDEDLLAYIALTRARRQIRVSYAAEDAAGVPLTMSRYVEQLVALGAREVSESDRASARRPPLRRWEFGLQRAQLREDDSADAQRLRRLALGEVGAGLGLDRDLAALGDPLPAFHAPGVLDEFRTGGVGRGLKDSEAESRDQASSEQADREVSVWNTSAREINTLLVCPFQHFAEYRLSLRRERGPRSAAAQLGLLGHAVMAEATRGLMQRGGAGIDDAAVDRIYDEAAATVCGQRTGDEPPRGALDVRLSLERWRVVFRAQVRRWRLGAFEPVAVEQAFGREDAWPAVEVRESDWTLRLGGVIDRIDRVAQRGDIADGAWLIIDYKQRTPPAFTSAFLTGERLQIWLYALLATAQLGADVPYGVLIAPLTWAERSKSSEVVTSERAERFRRLALRPRGVADVRLLDVLDPGLGVQADSEALVLKTKKDGTVAKSPAPSVAPRSAVAAYVELARETGRFALRLFASGVIRPEPLVEARQRACRTCPYQRVCRFEAGRFGVRVAEHVLPRIDEGNA